MERYSPGMSLGQPPPLPPLHAQAHAHAHACVHRLPASIATGRRCRTRAGTQQRLPITLLLIAHIFVGFVGCALLLTSFATPSSAHSRICAHSTTPGSCSDAISNAQGYNGDYTLALDIPDNLDQATNHTYYYSFPNLTVIHGTLTIASPQAIPDTYTQSHHFIHISFPVLRYAGAIHISNTVHNLKIDSILIASSATAALTIADALVISNDGRLDNITISRVVSIGSQDALHNGCSPQKHPIHIYGSGVIDTLVLNDGAYLSFEGGASGDPGLPVSTFDASRAIPETSSTPSTTFFPSTTSTTSTMSTTSSSWWDPAESWLPPTSAPRLVLPQLHIYGPISISLTHPTAEISFYNVAILASGPVDEPDCSYHSIELKDKATLEYFSVQGVAEKRLFISPWLLFSQSRKTNVFSYVEFVDVAAIAVLPYGAMSADPAAPQRMKPPPPPQDASQDPILSYLATQPPAAQVLSVYVNGDRLALVQDMFGCAGHGYRLSPAEPCSCFLPDRPEPFCYPLIPRTLQADQVYLSMDAPVTATTPSPALLLASLFTIVGEDLYRSRISDTVEASLQAVRDDNAGWTTWLIHVFDADLNATTQLSSSPSFAADNRLPSVFYSHQGHAITLHDKEDGYLADSASHGTFISHLPLISLNLRDPPEIQSSAIIDPSTSLPHTTSLAPSSTATRDYETTSSSSSSTSSSFSSPTSSTSTTWTMADTSTASLESSTMTKTSTTASTASTVVDTTAIDTVTASPPLLTSTASTTSASQPPSSSSSAPSPRNETTRPMIDPFHRTVSSTQVHNEPSSSASTSSWSNSSRGFPGFFPTIDFFHPTDSPPLVTTAPPHPERPHTSTMGTSLIVPVTTSAAVFIFIVLITQMVVKERRRRQRRRQLHEQALQTTDVQMFSADSQSTVVPATISSVDPSLSAQSLVPAALVRQAGQPRTHDSHLFPPEGNHRLGQEGPFLTHAINPAFCDGELRQTALLPRLDGGMSFGPGVGYTIRPAIPEQQNYCSQYPRPPHPPIPSAHSAPQLMTSNTAFAAHMPAAKKAKRSLVHPMGTVGPTFHAPLHTATQAPDAFASGVLHSENEDGEYLAIGGTGEREVALQDHASHTAFDAMARDSLSLQSHQAFLLRTSASLHASSAPIQLTSSLGVRYSQGERGSMGLVGTPTTPLQDVSQADGCPTTPTASQTDSHDLTITPRSFGATHSVSPSSPATLANTRSTQQMPTSLMAMRHLAHLSHHDGGEGDTGIIDGEETENENEDVKQRTLLPALSSLQQALWDVQRVCNSRGSGGGEDPYIYALLTNSTTALHALAMANQPFHNPSPDLQLRRASFVHYLCLNHLDDHNMALVEETGEMRGWTGDVAHAQQSRVKVQMKQEELDIADAHQPHGSYEGSRAPISYVNKDDKRLAPPVPAPAPDMASGALQLAQEMFERGMFRLLYHDHLVCTDSNGRTPLMYCAMYNNSRMCQLLLKHLVPMDTRDDRGRTALIYAVIYGSKDVLELLLKSPHLDSSVYAIEDDTSSTALHWALKLKEERILEAFLKHTHYLMDNPKHALAIAAYRADEDLIDLLFKHLPKVQLEMMIYIHKVPIPQSSEFLSLLELAETQEDSAMLERLRCIEKKLNDREIEAFGTDPERQKQLHKNHYSKHHREREAHETMRRLAAVTEYDLASTFLEPVITALESDANTLQQELREHEYESLI